ncbi:MAG: hypothetical protein NZ951_06490 [Dehalococcoidia bacterium]|nr:hypothetical protein [Dehalococcoidia bacterium]MDW8120615.1 hypothetical protein [Chloroflexota bacterium]
MSGLQFFLRMFLGAVAVLATLLIAGAWVFLLRSAPTQTIVLDRSWIRPRASYDTSRSFADLVRPHFYARTPRGEWREIEGEPERIVEHDGQVMVRLRNGQETLYVSLLALDSQEWGEHPVHKVYRLQGMGIPVEPALAQRLRTEPFPHHLFPRLRFEYLPGKEAEGVIAEVFPDGTFLVIPFRMPPEWQGGGKGLTTPSHLHVDPRALITRTSRLAQEWEREIRALPFDDQRYPPAPLARKDCQVYQEAVQSPAYRGILAQVGYRFTPAHVWRGREASTFADRLALLVWEGAGAGKQYFGMEGEWIGARLREMGGPAQECDAAGAIRPFPPAWRTPQQDTYIVLRRSLEPDRKRRFRVVALTQDGMGRDALILPGMPLLVFPHPAAPPWWVVSNEGWDGPAPGKAPDPRWSSLYLMHGNDPSRYVLVDFPFGRYGVTPRTETRRLLASSGIVLREQGMLLASLYGFTDEGGGLWLLPLPTPTSPPNPSAFTYLQPWDHSLTLLPLDYRPSPPTLTLLLTAKEVRDDFAMTAYVVRIALTEGGGQVERRERLMRMVGWNPVPFALHQVGEGRVMVFLQTHYDYYTSLLPRAKGVYRVVVDTHPTQPP